MTDEQTAPADVPPKRGKWIVSLIIVIGLAAAAYFGANYIRDNSLESSGPVAIVNGVEIPRARFAATLEQAQASQGDIGAEGGDASALAQQVLDGMIGEELLVQAAAADGITADQGKVQEQLDQIKGQFESDEAFQAELAATQTTEQELRDTIARGSVIQAYFDKKVPAENITVSSEEVQTQLDLLAEQVAGQEGVNPDDLKSLVEQQLQQQKRQELMVAHVEELRTRADVTVLL